MSVPFTCAAAAAALGFPGATVALCREQAILTGIVRVRLEGTPAGRLDRVVAVEGGVVSTERGGEAMVAFLRRSKLWEQPRIAAQELSEALTAFEARPPGFDANSGPRTVDEKGKPAWLALPDLVVTLEASGATGEGRAPGVRHPPMKRRAVLRGGPTTPFSWTIEEQRGAQWSVVQTIPLEPGVEP
ncbi:MAG: hypothetical protein Q8P18_32080 [Pseudomonadota bacterium]|nr:hypothetical protein [Pseudomonadota bacterium]